MRYVSTRGEAPELGFEDVLLTGLARDGGLYVPARWPQFSARDLRSLRGQLLRRRGLCGSPPFMAGAVPEAELKHMIAEAYAAFGHPAVAPLKQLDANQWLLELFHGPTLAFKDVAMQLLARLMDWSLARHHRRGHHRRRHLRRYRRRCHRRLQEQPPCVDLHPASAWPGERCPAPADDDGADAERSQHRHRGQFR